MTGFIDRARAAGLAVVVAGLLSGCTVNPDDVVPQRYVEATTVTPEAAEFVGEDRARAAAEAAIEFTLAHGTDPALIDPQKGDYSAAELTDGVVDAMTPELATVWRGLVADALTGDAHAANSLDGLQLHSLQEPTWHRPDTGDFITSQQVTDIEVAPAESRDGSVPAAQTVLVTLQHRTFAHVDTDKNPVDVIITRDMTYWMTPDPRDRWLISSYEGPFTVRSHAVLR